MKEGRMADAGAKNDTGFPFFLPFILGLPFRVTAERAENGEKGADWD